MTTGSGIAGLWAQVLAHRRLLSATDEFAARRREQQIKWMWTLVEQRMFTRLHSNAAIKAKLPKLEADVAEGRLSPGLAADEITAALGADKG